MLRRPTTEALYELRLDVMATALDAQRGNPDFEMLSFDERLGLLVDQELTERENRRVARHLKAARLKILASIEDVDFRRPRGLDRQQVLSLADAHFVERHHSVVIVGPTGVGKTYVACALAHTAIRHGHTALYLRAPRLFDELAIARADGRLARLTTSWARVGVLVIDDFLLRPLGPDQAADLLEVIEDRSARSTIITSQLPVELWHEALGDATIADAVLDRVLEHAHRIDLHGDSMRRAPSTAATKRTKAT